MDEAAKDVALAWKSLQKAKAVLQRIENKFDHQMWSCAKSQAARRKLWHEESLEFGHTAEHESDGDETAWTEKRSNEIPPACRRGKRAALPAAWSQPGSSESSGSSGAMPLAREGCSRSARCGPAGREAEDGAGAAGTWSPAESLDPPRTDSSSDQANSRSQMAQTGNPACVLHHPSRSPAAAPLPVSCLPPGSRPGGRELEEARKKSPSQKLEQLKERIREQRRHRRAAAREQKCPNAAYTREPRQKRAVRKVASAPPAPAYRGFSAVNVRSALLLPDEECGVPQREELSIPGRWRDDREALQTPGERSSAWRIRTQSQRQPSPRSSVPERAETDNGTKLPGASAWREGQKLARKLLGPPPKFAKPKSTAEEHITANTLEPGRGFAAMPAREHSSRERGNKPLGKSPEFKSCVVPRSEPAERGRNTPDEDTKQILRNLHLQSKHHDEHRNTRLPEDTAKGQVEDLQQYLGISSPSPGAEGMTPSAFSGEKTRSSLMRAETEYRNRSRGKSTSPQRRKGSRSPAQKGSEKENLNHPSKRRANMKKPHPYSPEIIQEFIYRKNAERKKKSLEEKKSLVQAMEMRNKRLQEVYRKQKEAFGKKTCSEQTHKFIKETASAEESPQHKPEQKQPSSGTLERSFMAWVHETSHTLLSEGPRSRDPLLKTVQPSKKRGASASPAPLESECWFLSSPKREGLMDRSAPALYTLPQSCSLPWQDAKPDSKDLPSGLSPYRNKQDRVKAIHSLSRELVEKVELATKRLNATSRVQDSADKISTQTTWDLFKGSSSHSEPDTSKGEQDRTMTIQMLLEAPSLNESCVSSDREFHGLGRISLVGSAEGTTVQDRQKTAHAPSSAGSAVGKELPWITRSARQRHLLTGEDLSNTLKGFLVDEGSEVDISLLREKPITSPVSVSHRFLAGSPQREPAAPGTHCPREAALNARTREEIADRCPAASLGTPGSRTLGPSAPLPTGAEVQGGFERDFGEGDLSCTELEEKHRSHLGNLKQTSLQLAHKLQAHQLQQKQQLAALSEKAKLEVEESQRSLSDLLQHNLEECSSSRADYSSVPRRDHAKQKQRSSQSEGNSTAGESNGEARTVKQPGPQAASGHRPMDPPAAGGGRPLGGRRPRGSELRGERDEPPHGPHTSEPARPPGARHGGEAAGAGSQGGEAGRCHGGAVRSRFGLAVAEQCLRGEELRGCHQAALLRLRRRALRERAAARLAWLDLRRRCLENLQDSKGASALAEKQRKILTELQQEQAEIQHLQNIYKAAHQERKLLLKHQREILMMQRSTAQLQEELNNLTGKQEFTKSPATEEAIKQKTTRLISCPMPYSISAESTAQSERPGLPGNRESCVQLKNKQSKKYEGLSTENKKPLVQHQKQAEESPALEQSLDVEAPDVSETVDKTLCDATGQNTGSLFMVKDHENTELNAQDHVFLHLEHANSARIDEGISTPVPREGRKYALPESVLEEKAFISSPKLDLKNNEDINPCDSKFTVKGLGMLSTLCNLCLVEAESTLQETGDSTSPIVEDLENDSLTVEKVHREQRSHEAREERDSGSPFQAGGGKKHLSSDSEEDGERGSLLISDGATVVKTQLRKERPSEEQRISTDSKRKSEITHLDEKSPFEISLSQDVPVKEVEVPVPHEISQVDGSQWLKHLDPISHETSDEELDLKAFSKGLSSTESSSKSDNFSLTGGSAKSDSLLPEFQKVSAIWIDISESSISDSELEVKNGEDTDVGIPEEFAYDNDDVFPNISTETLIAVNDGMEMLPGDKHDEQVPKADCSPEISSCCQNSQKYPGDVPDHGDHLLYFIPSDKGNASKTKPPHVFQSDNPAKGMDEPHLEASENYGRNDTSSQEISEQDKDAGTSSSYNDDIYPTKKICAQQDSSSTASRVKKDGELNSISVDQNTELMGFLLTDSLKCLDLDTDQFSNTVSFPPERGITNDKLVACVSSRDLSVSEGENNHTQLLNEKLSSSKLSKIVSLPTSMPGISEEAHKETEISSYESLQRVATGNQNNSTTQRQAIKEMGRGLLSSASSKEQLFQAENCSSKGEDDTIFISDEGLLSADEDTLSEILSPVDEVLSYGSADLPSSNKKDLSFPSEDPPPPLGVDAMKNDDSSFSTDDFPSPPEQMTFSETRQCMDEDISLKTDALPPLPDNIVPEELPLLNPEPIDVFSTQDGNLSEQSLVKEDISSAKKDLLEHQQGGYEMSLQCLEFLHVPNPVSSGEASKNTGAMKKLRKTHVTLPKAEEESHDPLLSFEIGDRVLVKKTQPGTLMFKGRTCFDSGYWAGVALDKAEGDNSGTYQGVKYFECAQHCGIFVRPDQISHLLEANDNGSNDTEDEDSDSFYDDESFQGDCKYTEDDKQGAGITEQKAEDTNNVGGSEVKEKQSRLHIALLSGTGQKFPNSGQCKGNEFLCQNNLMSLQSDKEKTELTQIKQSILADMLPVENKTSNTDERNTSKNICCSVEDQKRKKLIDDIASELSKKLLFDTLIAFSETAQHKHKSAFEEEVINYGKGPQQEDNQKRFLFKENPADSLSKQSAKVSDVLLCGFDMLSIHGCHTVAERIVTKFVDDALKEYKKIRRKQGAKAGKIFHLSSDTSPTTLPFLIKILDAGVFGSSEDFDQLNSDQCILERQTQKQYLYKLDQWHSAPWKKTAEVPLVVPHYSSSVKKLSAHAVEELWTPENMHSSCRRISVPKHFECNDFSENNLETESKRMYNQIIFDLTHELLCAEYHVTVNPNAFPWLKENLGSCYSRHLCRRTDVNEVKTFVQGEIIKIMNLEKNDLEMKRKFLKMSKYGNCKRDRVDLILIQELRKEESQWTYYDDDELTVKMRITEDIFDSLILDTIRVLNKIYLTRACD